eukprot:COSAG02_NODE_2768_length_8063_cov_17.175163_7_plen_59_part_01
MCLHTTHNAAAAPCPACFQAHIGPAGPANDDRDIDLYHWSSARFSAAWIDTISVLLAKG